MTEVLPSQVVSAIETMFGPMQGDLHHERIRPHHQVEVRALLDLLAEVPRNLITLPFVEHLEFTRCRAVLSEAAARWNFGDIRPARDVGGRDPVERIRRLMSICSDELPPKEPILTFIAEDDVRIAIEDQIQAAWTDFSAREWIGATVLAGAALEAILYWAVKGQIERADTSNLIQLIEAARRRSLISEETKQQAKLAKDARNLIHPGRADRSGNRCTRATALTALAAVYRVSDDLERFGASQL